jgi:transposase
MDVHKKTVVACLMITDSTGRASKEVRTFGTTTAEILALGDWLREAGCTHIAMESTGVYWKPIYNLLEAEFTLLLVNATHVRNVPGRKTDVKDSEWLADLLRHGLLRPSFVPPIPQRALRELTRYRATLIHDRARCANRVQKVLEDTNIKLASVVSDIQGVSARAMLRAILAGETNPATLADLARGRLREKRDQLLPALEGHVRDHHRFLLTALLAQIDYLDEAVETVGAEIAARMAITEEAIARLDDIPGVSRRVAEVVLAEIGSDVTRFPTAGQLASWVGVCPGNHQSAGKRYSGRTQHGNVWLRQALMEAAHGAARSKRTYLQAQYYRLAARRGRKRAIVAVAHTLVVIIYHMLKGGTLYQDLGATYFENRDRQAVTRRAVKRLERLGYSVSLAEPSAAP